MRQPSVNAFFQARKKASKPNAKKALFSETQPSNSKEKESSGIKKPLNVEKDVSTAEKSAQVPKPNLETLQPRKVDDSKVFQSPLKLKAIPETGIKSQSPLKRDLTDALESPAKHLAPTAEESPSKQAKRGHTTLTPSKLLSPKIPVRSPGHGISKSAQKPVHRLESSAKKALFLDKAVEQPKKPGFPSLTKSGIDIKVSVPERKKVPASPIKASPRKKALEDAEKVVDKVKNLLQPSDILPLPHSYKDLANIFRTVDDLISHGHNFNLKAIKDKALKALRKPLTDSHLKQIKCVYPKAYLFSWESKKDSRGQPLQDYDLHLYPNFENNKDCKMTPGVRVEREKMFKHHLLTIVQDHHQEFLQTLGIDTLENSNIHRWHKDFDVEKHCPVIEEEEFPVKPTVESPERNPKAMLEKITGLNASVEKALKKVVEVTTPIKSQMTPSKIKALEADVQLSPALRDLPPHLIAKIKADEKQRRIKEMTMDKSQQKEVESMEELLHNRVSIFYTLVYFIIYLLLSLFQFFTTIINCHKTFSKGKAVPMDTLCARMSDSSGKSKQEVSKLLKLFIQICPQVMKTKVIKGMEQVLGYYNKAGPNFTQMEDDIKKALHCKKNEK